MTGRSFERRLILILCALFALHALVIAAAIGWPGARLALIIAAFAAVLGLNVWANLPTDRSDG